MLISSLNDFDLKIMLDDPAMNHLKPPSQRISDPNAVKFYTADNLIEI